MVQPNFNASLTYQITPKITTYATYNYSQSSATGNGGGYVPSNGSQFTSAHFHRISQLEEVGFKFSLLKDTLFISTAGFHQTRSVPTQGGAANTADVLGYRNRGQLPAEQELLHDGRLFDDPELPLQPEPGLRVADAAHRTSCR